MEKRYMDYGQTVDSNKLHYLLRPTPIDYTKHGQTFYNTHTWEIDKETGEGRYVSLPYFNKAFISFTYGGRKIEDFGLNAITVNERLDRETPPEHEDYTTLYKMLNGQYYWGSHYNAREMTITLATDGMTQSELDDFKYWFQAGEIRELILSEHPNRGILARIGEAPEIAVLPFPRTIVTTIDDVLREIKVILYKGNIQLNFVMDDPFWYAIKDVLGNINYDQYGHGYLVDSWVDANGKIHDILKPEEDSLENDAYKVMMEDHIPLGRMVNGLVNFANGLGLEQYNARKYTLDEDVNNEIPEGSIDTKGAPLINDDKDISYPLTGAVIGPLYRLGYEDEQVIDVVSDDTTIELVMFGSNKKFIKYEHGSLLLLHHIAMNNFIPIHSGSTITDICGVDTVQIEIARYILKDGIYTAISEALITLEEEGAVWTNDKDCYIRITAEVVKNRWPDDKEFKFSNLISWNLITFSEQGHGVLLNNSTEFSYFYSGTAMSYPQLSFTVPITFDTKGYITTFPLERKNSLEESVQKYNILKLESNFSHELKLTNPGIFMAYNQAIDILRDESEIDLPSMIQLLRESIGHPAVRSWAINCLNIYVNNPQAWPSDKEYITSSADGTEVLMVNASLKKKILDYMPFLFASIEDANISIKEDLPKIQKITTVTLSNDDLTYTVYSEHNITLEDRVIRIPLNTQNPYSVDITPICADNKGKYFQWQYSNDNGESWYNLKDSDTWQIDDKTYTLTHAITSLDDYNYLLRCFVSNDASRIENPKTIYFVQMPDTFTITRENSASLTVDQNSKVTSLSWTIEGAYNNNAGYEPAIYYESQEEGETKKSWKLYNRDNRNYFNQIRLGVLEKSSDEDGNTVYTFSFNACENSNKELRGTRFKLVAMFQLNTWNRDELARNINAKYPVIIDDKITYTININRLEAANALIESLTTRYRNSLGVWTTQDYTSEEELKQPISAVENTKTTPSYIKVVIANVVTSSILRVNIQIRHFDKQQLPDQRIYTYITPKFTTKTVDTSLNKLTLEWKVDKTWNKAGRGFQICLKDTKDSSDNLLIYFIPANQGYDYLLVTSTDLNTLNQEIPVFLEGLTYNQNLVSSLIQQYESNSKTLVLSTPHLSAEKPCNGTLKYSITCKWYYNSSSSNFNFDEDEPIATISTDLQTTNVLWNNIFPYTISPITKDKAGWYNIQTIITIYGEGSQDNPNYIYTSDYLTLDKPILVQIISLMSFGDIISDYSSGIYYTEIKLFDINNNKTFTTNDDITLLFKCKINNYSDSSEIISKELKLQYKINATQKNYKSKSTKPIIINDNNEYFIKWTENLITTSEQETSIQRLYAYNNYIFRFIASDTFGRKFYSEDITLNYESYSSRVQNLTRGNNDDYILETPASQLWCWPVLDIVGTMKTGLTTNNPYYWAANVNTNAVTKTYNFNWKIDDNDNKTLLLKGIPKQSHDKAGIKSYIGNNEEFLTSPQNFTPPSTTGGGTIISGYQYPSGWTNYTNADDKWTKAKKALLAAYTGYLTEATYLPVIKFNVNKLRRDYQTITLQGEFSNLHPSIKYLWRISATQLDLQFNPQEITSENNILNLEIDFTQIDYSQLTDGFLSVELRIVYDLNWPKNINIERPTTATINQTTYHPTVKYAYNENNFPTEDNATFKIIAIQGIPIRGVNRSTKNISNVSNATSRTYRLETYDSNLMAINEENSFSPIQITQKCPISINCATGEYTMQVKYNTINWPNGILLADTNNGETLQDSKVICHLSSLRYGESITATESVGDMVLFNNFVFTLQNHFDPVTNNLLPWSETDKTACHKLTYDGEVPLENFVLNYKNLYL